MRTRSLLVSAAFVIVPFSLRAQLRDPTTLNGVWHQTEVHVERPDSTFNRAASQGMTIIYNGHFMQVYVAPPMPGVQQAARPSTPEEKAERYDRMTANGGTFDMTDSTFVIHYSVSKLPTQTTATVRYRLRGDSLWQFATTRWAQDTTKMVHTTYKWVRQK